MFLIVGRVPDRDNVTFQVHARTFAEAKKRFANALWEGVDREERASVKSLEGADHYIEFAVEVKGKYRLLVDPEYGEMHGLKWEKA